jgi:hypothetical protein
MVTLVVSMVSFAKPVGSLFCYSRDFDCRYDMFAKPVLTRVVHCYCDFIVSVASFAEPVGSFLVL